LIFIRINQAIAAHGAVTRVVIADIKGSSPREIGASMLLWPGGQSGSIGGGALEYQASQAPRPGLRRYPLGPELGQCCGGHVTLVTEHFTSPLTQQMSSSAASKGTWPCRCPWSSCKRPGGTDRQTLRL
jgi:xanthine dehydrogenase accessory factor